LYNLLIVDDEYIVRKGLIKTIDWDKVGVNVTGEAENGIEALNFVKKNKIDVILVDVRMPKMNGIELIKQIKKLYPEIISIILSGHREFSYAQNAMSQGVKYYLLKPTRIDDIYNVFKKVKSELDERQNLDKMINDYKLMKRDSFFSNLLDSRMDKKKVEMAIKKLEVRFEKPIYILVLLDIDNEDLMIETWREKKGKDFRKELLQYVKKIILNFDSNNNIFCFMNFDKIYLLWNCNESISQNAYNEIYLVRDLIEEEYSDKDVSVTFFIGRPVKDINKIGDISDELRKSIQIKFIMGYGTCINTDNINSGYWSKTANISYNKTLINEKISKLVGYIKMANRLNVEECLEEICFIIENMELLNKDIVQEICLNIVFALSSNIDNFYEKIWTMHGESELPVHRIRRFKTYKEIKSWLKGLIYSTKSYVEKNDGISNKSGIDKVIEYINKNYNQRLFLKELAQKFYINANYCCDLFKKNTGKTFSQYVISLKMKKAEELLLYSSYSISEVASMSGYSDYYFFNKVFKKEYGCTPSQFRKSKIKS